MSASLAMALRVKVSGVEKRLSPKAHIVYVILVDWSNGEKTTILRRFKDIYKFHVRMPMNGYWVV